MGSDSLKIIQGLTSPNARFQELRPPRAGIQELGPFFGKDFTLKSFKIRGQNLCFVVMRREDESFL